MRLRKIVQQDLEADVAYQILGKIKDAYRSLRTFQATGTYWSSGMSREQSFFLAFQKRTSVTPDYFFLDCRRDPRVAGLTRKVVWCRGWRCFSWEAGEEIEKARNFSIAIGGGIHGFLHIVPKLLFRYGGSYDAFAKFDTIEFTGTDRLMEKECLLLEATDWDLRRWDRVLRELKLPEIEHHLAMEQFVEIHRKQGIENPCTIHRFWIDPYDFLIRKIEVVYGADCNADIDHIRFDGYALYHPEVDVDLDMKLFHFTPPSGNS